MKNSDLPAMPCTVPANKNYSAQMSGLGLATATETVHQGLTKREVMAMHLMAAMISAPLEKFNMNNAAKTASCAVESSDALLRALDITCQKS